MFVYSRKAHYHETDQMGVVHHANYPKWMEEARVAFLDSLGMSYRAMEEAGLRIDVKASAPEIPSVARAIELYLENNR